MKNKWVFGAAALAGAQCLASEVKTSDAAVKPNVLFIVVDDLNDWLGCLGGHPQARTPNIDRLAAQSVLFTRNQCPAPMCNPSRTAFLLGRRPDTTGVFGNADEWQKICPQYTSLPGYFRGSGYYTAGCGKLFHAEKNTRSADWNEYFGDFKLQIPLTKYKVEGRPLCGLKGHAGFMDYGPLNTADDNMRDMQIAAWAEAFLQRRHDGPFFLGAGIFLPHYPMYAPKKYFDAFPLETIQLPPIKPDDLDDVPVCGKALAGNDGAWSRAVLENRKEKEVVQAYLACVNFADACVGRILTALENSPYADNTIVLLMGDNGMHNGEKGRFSKFTLWERSTRVPLMIRLPGKGPSEPCDRTVNLLDLYPTLVEACGLPAVSGLDGRSLMPLLKNPVAEWEHPSVTTYHAEHSVTTERWRYIQYHDGTGELYDHQNDPNEWNNIFSNPEYVPVIDELKKAIPVSNHAVKEPTEN